VAVAAIVRLAAWAIIPGARFASDEQGYVDAGVALAVTGQQDLFWPPLTGWIIAVIKTIAPSMPLGGLRLVWVMFDLANVVLVAVIATRLAARILPPDGARRLVFAATLGYALYLPAISHAQFVTSEMPALLLVLSSLAILTSGMAPAATVVGAGIALGLLTLARANLVPLAVLLPAAVFSNQPRPQWLGRIVAVAAIAAIFPAAVIAWNATTHGDATLSRNAAYNLYIGNQDFYAEDLDLFHPQATPQQIEFRRKFFAGTLEYPSGTAAELQSAALNWIVTHPGAFLKRALGRLARVFAPKTDVLELVGGEASVGVFSPASIALLGIANLQWVMILFGGLLGVCMIVDRDRTLGATWLAAIAGSVILCLVAIAKPRYSFVFDPLLIVAAALALTAAAEARLASWRRWWRVLTPVCVFLAWGWIAWLIFSLSSRMAS
jgi:4-amino-4-deoxy-L-arabinose transferase-like glycosyltransferase